MKTILSEIKNFKRLTRIVESDDRDVKVALIGDGLTYYLKSNDFINIPGLSDENMTINKMLMRLSAQGVMPEIDHVFISIGTDDKFKDKKDIPFLVEALDNVFPNAEINVIKAIIDEEFFYGGEEVEDFKILENDILSYYNVFKQNGIKVLGNYPSIDYGLGNSDSSIMMLKKQMADALFQNITNNGEKLNPLSVDEPFIYKNNIDISGDDETDFDTIYEFLNRFEEIVRSGNRYDSRVRNSFRPDIEQIQMALKFLMPNSNLEITGKFDTDTEETIYNYQEEQNIEANGIADRNTLEEILFDLKSKSFDDDDLGKYLKELGVDTMAFKKDRKKYKGTADAIWKSFTDKIIDNFEGGYWNNDITKSNSQKCVNHPTDDVYENSGETMFGIDRRAGGWDNTSEGREYFGLIDDEKDNYDSMEQFCKVWKWNYRGGPLESELKSRAGDLMLMSYNRNKKFLSSKALKEVESNKRLLFHFAYACWNGSGHFQDFAEIMNRAVGDGLTGDDLVDVAIDSRNKKFGSGGWADANQKVVDIIKNDPSLEN
jgi:peptidoglycan hydrolase-like protein with peptidoglycan-binding domain